MNRFLLIDEDVAVTQKLGLACLDRQVGVIMAPNVCEGVRALLSESVSLIVVEATALKLTAREMATLFERVAPGVPVAVTVRSDTLLDARVALELAGFRVLTKPVAVEDLLDKIGALSEGAARR
jgi:DNA-binding response OmpR family regulator